MAETAIPSLKQLRGLKDLPAVRQIALLVGLAFAVAAGAAMFNWSQQPNYAPVYPGLVEKDASEVAEALRGAGLPFRLDPQSGAVTVRGDKVYEARMRLAAQGLPKGSAMGFEMIQQDQGLGTSQFIESARYQMALETELARTVSSLQPVKAARVHLALPKASPFVRSGEGASASVLVELNPGRQLDQGQVSAIVHIVSSSVSDMSAGAVSVIDQYGHLLTQADPDSELAQSAAQFDQTHRMEADYVRRVEQLLTPMLGSGRVSAQVAADMDFSFVEEARESYRPDSAAVRSEQTSEDISRNGNSVAQGIPGATSNQPPAAAAKAAAVPAKPNAKDEAAQTKDQEATTAIAATDQPLTQSHTSTRNYELDRTVSHTRQPVGRLRRLSVAVLVDNMPQLDPKTKKTVMVPLAPEEMTKVQALVKEAVGFDAARGDSVSVQNAAFVTAEAPALDPLPLWQRPELRDIARQGLGALIVLALIFAVLRPLLRNLVTAPRRAALTADETAVALAQEQLSLGGPGAAAGTGPYDQRLALARSAAGQDPKRVAQVVKTWLGENG